MTCQKLYKRGYDSGMKFTKEDLEIKQDEVAGELCALLEKAGSGGESSRVFEIPEYARRRLDMSLSGAVLTGYFASLIINDWKRKDHHEGGVSEERITEHDLLTGIALLLKKQGLKVFRAEGVEDIYILGIEKYGGIPVAGIEEGNLYQLYSSDHTTEAWKVSCEGIKLVGNIAQMAGTVLTLTTNKGKSITLKSFDLSEGEFIRQMKQKSERVGGGN